MIMSNPYLKPLHGFRGFELELGTQDGHEHPLLTITRTTLSCRHTDFSQPQLYHSSLSSFAYAVPSPWRAYLYINFLLDNYLSSGLNVGVFSGKPSLIPSVLFRYLSSLLSWICVHILQHLSFPFKWFPLVVLFSPWKHHCLTHLWPYYLSQCFLS